MGRSSGSKGILEGQGALFSPDDGGSANRGASLLFSSQTGIDLARAPLHTNAKSRLISEYISKYQLVTHGGLFIDGFSAPQRRSDAEAWTARRVLELEPKWIRAFWLCDSDSVGIQLLYKLKAEHHLQPRSRSVWVMHGDFNVTVHTILKNHRLRRKTPVFVLLDQRSTECHWSTVKAIAARAGDRKIEMLYFLGTSWLHRSLMQAARPEKLLSIDRWWGDGSWRGLIDLSQPQIVQKMADRFKLELGYNYVTPYAVMRDERTASKVFYLIHASDHADAPKLMTRAYKRIFGSIPGSPSDDQLPLL